MVTDEERTESVKSMRSRTKKLEREGDCWTAEEKDRVTRMFGASIDITDMALRIQGTEPAVIQQIEKLNLYERKAKVSYGKSISKLPICVCSLCGLDRSFCPRCNAHNRV